MGWERPSAAAQGVLWLSLACSFFDGFVLRAINKLFPMLICFSLSLFKLFLGDRPLQQCEVGARIVDDHAALSKGKKVSERTVEAGWAGGGCGACLEILGSVESSW